MADEKLILAHCGKTGKKFCIEVKNKNGRYMAVNFVELSGSAYDSLTSELRGDGLKSADTLLACRFCGSRAVGGCSCNRRRKQCSSAGKYDFQCLYCDQLILDPPRSAKKTIYVSSSGFDNIGDVLTSMGVSFSPFTGRFDCDILFLNCGTKDYVDTAQLKPSPSK